jgi:lysophospholipase L1-like esterase
MRTLLLSFAVACGLWTLHGAETNTPHHVQFEPAIRAFEAQDRTSPPPRDAILLVGSSSIRLWTNAPAAFPDHTILNRGFGGSHMSDLNAFVDRIVIPYRPPLIVLYEGDNDIASGKSPEEVLSDFNDFAQKVRKELPETRVAFIAIKPSPSRLKHLDRMREANRLIREDIADHPGWVYVDVFTPMLNDAGEPRQELFRSDDLHMKDAGYQLWADLLKPIIDRMAPAK